MTVEVLNDTGRKAVCVWFAPNGEGGWTGPFRSDFYIRFLTQF